MAETLHLYDPLKKSFQQMSQVCQIEELTNPVKSERTRRIEGVLDNNRTTWIAKTPRFTGVDMIVRTEWGTSLPLSLHNTWQHLRQRDMPVVEQMWVAGEDEKVHFARDVVMTDLSHEGWAFYDKTAYQQARRGERVPRITDTAFQTADRKQIVEMAKQITDEATKREIGFNPDDAMSLGVKADGTLKIWFLDIGRMSFTGLDVERINKEGLEDFVYMFDHLRWLMVQEPTFVVDAAQQTTNRGREASQ